MSVENPYETPQSQPQYAGTFRTFTLKRVDPLSCGLMLGVFYAILGLIFGAFASLFALVGAFAQNGNALGGIIGGVGAIIMMPIIYGVMGFIGGLIAALIYNGCAALIGGIKFDLE
ncbi:hypothetical protein FYK55_23755 [Roseiconus nitratireducens]|uniref:DUF3566 domain-containing protein n=1 Tax=Roseiconus nitratireducens TaxID=2605748 RepID=A0A5M6CWJ7_9BACT|nr:hypothetical protein [Roseiconus nitratireducens]KAA5539591.1 hypothetical protein FYK55_23755 [Roseiconus nitratireducens]